MDNERFPYTAPDGSRYNTHWSSRKTQHQITFDRKPSSEVRQNMKDHGARWNRAGYWSIHGFRYAGDDIPMIVNGDENAGCHGQACKEDEMMYSSDTGY